MLLSEDGKIVKQIQCHVALALAGLLGDEQDAGRALEVFGPILYPFRFGAVVFLRRADGGGEREQPLLRGVNRQLAAIHRDPAPAQLLRHRRRSAAASEAVEDDVARRWRMHG